MRKKTHHLLFRKEICQAIKDSTQISSVLLTVPVPLFLMFMLRLLSSTCSSSTCFSSSSSSSTATSSSNSTPSSNNCLIVLLALGYTATTLPRFLCGRLQFSTFEHDKR